MPITAHPLYLPEILRVIFEYSTLNPLNLALVCKAWSDSAFPLIWDTIPFYAVLILCPQAGIVRYNETSQSPVAGPTRLSRYALMVHTLDVPEHCDLWKWKRAIAQLVDSVSPRELFPNLQRIHIFADSLLPRDIETIHYFLSKRTTFLELQVLQTLPAGLLKLIQQQVPELRTLVLRNKHPKFETLHHLSPPSMAALVDSLRGLPKLNYVAIPREWSEEDVINVLSQSPCLETLRFTVITSPWSTSKSSVTLPKSLLHGSFPQLRTLEIHSPFHNAISCLSPSNAIPHLNSLDIVSHEEPALQLRLLVEIVAKRYPHISVLRITTRFADLESSDDISRMMDSLQTLTALRHLSIQHTCLLQLDEGQISTLGRHLTQLEVLGLRLSLEFDSLRPRIGVHSLIQFSQSFPKLRKLQLHVDLSAFAFPAVLPDQKLRHLKRLHVGGWTSVRNSAALATFLDELIPDACLLGSIDCDPVGWSEVVDIVQTRRKMRNGRA